MSNRPDNFHLVLVVPCFNEAVVLPHWQVVAMGLAESLAQNGLACRLSVCFVDDGSSDASWTCIEKLAVQTGSVVFQGIKLARNFGHQNALMAGLLLVEGDAVITVDADFQDDISVVLDMARAFQQGADVVYGLRDSRQTDTWFKRTSANLYYAGLRRMGVEVLPHHADFRLMSRRAIEVLRSYPERNIFLRGLVPTMGLPQSLVYYHRKPRLAGETKYPLGRMLALGWDGVTSFSTAPLRAVTSLGLVVSVLSLVFAAWAAWVRLVEDAAVPGWASIVIPVAFLAGIQILSIGVIGEYLAKVFIEVKHRPLYVVEKSVGAVSSSR